MIRFTDKLPCIPPKMIKEIAAEHPAPFYLYSEKQILSDLNAVFTCFAWQDQYRNYFPMKENYNPVILRYAPDSKEHPQFRRANFDRLKTGLNKSELLDILFTLRVRKTPVVGLELQMKPFDLHPDACLTRVKLLYSLVHEIRERTDIKIAILNPGDDTVPGRLQHISDGICSFMKEIPLEIRPQIHTTFSHMILNPGSYLISEVTAVRNLQQSHLVLNSSCGQFLRAALFNSDHDAYVVRTRRTRAIETNYALVGINPENFDRLSADTYYAKAAPGDLFVIFDMGCSARSMPMLYHFTSICPEYILHIDGTVAQIGAGKSEDEVMEFLTT